VVDAARHEDWHHYHQQQLVRMVHQIDRQAKVTGGLIMRFGSFVNKGGDDDGDSGITVDLLAFATYWIGAGMAIGVLAWSVSERRWLPAGAMLLFALGAMYLAYREIRPAGRSEPRHAVGSHDHANDRDVDVRESRPEPTPNPAYSPAPPAQAQAQHQQYQYQPQEQASPPRPQPTATQPVPAQPQYESQFGESTWGTPNGRTPPVRRNDGWR
jgi:hypothetical protein